MWNSSSWVGTNVASGVDIGHNTKFSLIGHGNSGWARHNTNCAVDGSSNDLSLSHNTNGRFIGHYNALVCGHTTNVSLSGDKNRVTMEHETNSKVHGNDNTCTLKSDTNFKLNGHRNHVTMKATTDSVVNGDDNSIDAEHTTNLEVVGNHNDVKVQRVVNHRLSRSADTLVNKMLFSRPTGGRVMVNGLVNPYKVLLDYVNCLRIDKDAYNVGMFKFKMMQYNTDQDGSTRAQVIVDRSDHDNNLLQLQVAAVSAQQVVITGSRDKRTEELHIQGPKVTHQILDGGAVQVNVERQDSLL